MKKRISTYIYAYKNSSINIFTKPLDIYLKTVNLTLGDINYYITIFNKDKSINRSQFEDLMSEIKNIKELIILKHISPPTHELELIKKHNVKIITISKSSELIGVKK